MKRKIILFSMVVLISAMFHSCKEIDLTRIAAVHTDAVDYIQANSAMAYAEIIDLGEVDRLDNYGFCWSTNNSPKVIDYCYYFDLTAGSTKSFESNIYGLQANTTYYIRAFVDEDGEIRYGNVIQFETDNNTQPPDDEWLYYDNGINNDNGIGYDNGTSFDAAIRFPTSVTEDYDGYYVSKFRFFIYEGSSTDLSVTVWEADPYDDPDLIYYEDVTYFNVGSWTEYSPSELYYIQPGKELWVGVWIKDYIVGYYPMGVDAGPATQGYSDLISTDLGDSWFTLSENDLNYNWNIQVFIANYIGDEKQLTINNSNKREWEIVEGGFNTESKLVSKKQNETQIKK